MAEARVAALEASLELQKANVQETEENIRYMHIYAPFDGTVVDKQGEVGEIINPMSMSSTLGPVGRRDAGEPREDGGGDRRRREPALADRARPAGGGLRQRRARASTTAAGSARSSRWATARGGRSRSRSRSSTPTTTSSPSWSPPSTSCPTRR